MLGPFAKRTHGIDDATVRKIALFAFAVATAAVVIGAFVGRSLLFNWNVSIAAMAITGGSEIRRVTVDNFTRAETDTYSSKFVKDGGFGSSTTTASSRRSISRR